MPSSPELAILRHLAARTHAGAAEIGISLRMTGAEFRARLVMLASMRLIAGRQDKADGKSRRVSRRHGRGAAEGGDQRRAVDKAVTAYLSRE